MRTHHTITFISDRGHVWEIGYYMEKREVTSVTSFAVDGKRYPVRTVSRETLILNAASTQADLVEWACDDIAERETHHMCDD